MNIGFVSTRLAGTDGVSLETGKWATIFRRLGHHVYYCAGELDPDGPAGMLVPKMHFQHPEIEWIYTHAFGTTTPAADLYHRINVVAEELQQHLERFLMAFKIDLLVVENALAIPMNVPLGIALRNIIAQTGVPTVGHHHDFYWERERFLTNCIQDILDDVFPPALPNICHVTISSSAHKSLKERRGMESEIIPNIFDFARAAPGLSAFSRDLRTALGLTDENLFILQPTRVVRRKGIELSLELVRRLRQPAHRKRLLGKDPVLIITHRAGDEGVDYLEELQHKAQELNVPLIYAATRFGPRPRREGTQKIYSLWDAYVHADFVTYPSRYEGFGNALLESIYFRLPTLVNRYSVYVTDIAPLGFDLIEISGEVTDSAVEATIEAIIDPVRRRRMVEYNYYLAMHHFSYEAIMPKLQRLLTICLARS